MLLALAGRPCYCLMPEAFGLTVDLAIGEAESIRKEIATSFFECFFVENSNKPLKILDNQC